MQDERFLKEYRKARRGILENVIAKLQGLTFAAIDTLERNLSCENSSVEVRCAAVVLDQALKGLELLDVEARLETLEILVKHQQEEDVEIRRAH